MVRKVGVVVPTNRPERMETWLEAWDKELKDHRYDAKLYRIDDTNSTWESIRDSLGSRAWIIPVKTDCIRSFGYLQAFKDGMDYTVTLDDDVHPKGDEEVIWTHLNWLEKIVEPDNWQRTLMGYHSPPTRGLPMARSVGINHGLWTGMPDVSAMVQLQGFSRDYEEQDSRNDQIIPKGKFYPMSGMNLAFNTRLTPFMYFTLQGYNIMDPKQPWGLHRCGDILAGVLSKQVIDSFDYTAVHSGRPYVHHTRASDANNNLILERNTYAVPQIVAQRIKDQTSYRGCAEALFHLHIAGVDKTYFRNLSLAMREWYALTTKGEYVDTRASSIASRGPVSEPQDADSSDQRLAEGEGIS